MMDGPSPTAAPLTTPLPSSAPCSVVCPASPPERPRLTRKRWRRRRGLEPSGDSHRAIQALATHLKVPPLMAELLVGRGYGQTEQAQRLLDPKLSHLHDPGDLPGADRAARRIVQALADHQPIVIYSDYDVDGVTAASILWQTLHLADPDAPISVYTPHRLEEGYGLNVAAIEGMVGGRHGGAGAERHGGTEARRHGGAAEACLPLVVSVDCGISAVRVAKEVKEMGVELIITDHHHFDPENLPEAHALVHPRLKPRWQGQAQSAERGPGSTSEAIPDSQGKDQPYPTPDLCGAGVAFKLAWQIANVHCGCDSSSSGNLPEAFRHLLLDLLSLAALGTVADVVPLVGENRVLSSFGLSRIKATRFLGLNALIDAARLRNETVSSYHVGFVLGPRLNACGRMGHAGRAVKLLTDADPTEAVELASFLNNENDRRRQTERTILDDARQRVIERGDDAEDRRAIVVAGENWHPGVVGIVASRLVEAFNRPTVVLCIDHQADTAQGSARSVDGVCIHTALSACEDQLTRFGGHAMAAGLSLPLHSVEPFRQRLVEVVNAMLSIDRLTGELEFDAEFDLSQCTLDLFDQITRLAPFGRGNPTPRLLLRNLVLDRPAQRMGREGKHLTLFLRSTEPSSGQRRVYRAIGFGLGEHAPHLPAGVHLELIFKPQINTWQNRRRPEIHIEDLRFAGKAPDESEVVP